MEKIKFNNGKLTILQISDPQDTQWVRRTMLTMLNKACDKVNPDLIIFTGDNILGNHLCDMRFGSKQRKLSREAEFKILETAIHHITNIPEKRNIPFAIIFGNHDDRNSFTKDEQADIYRACKMNRGLETSGKLCGTYRLPVYSTDGENNLFDIYMIDTAYLDHAADKGYEEITPEAVEWYKKESSEHQNPAMMFMHIPLKELNDFVETTDDGRVIGLKNGASGDVGEHVSFLPEDNGFYEAVKNNGNTKMIISGHDHTNCFTGHKDGIDFVATPTASFRCYGNHTRGVRVFDIYEHNPENIYTYTLNMSDLMGDGFVTKLRYFWDADEMEKTKYTVLGAAALTGAAAVAGGIIKKWKSK